MHNEKSKNYYMNDHVKFVKNKKSFLIQTYSDLYHFKNYNDNKIFNNISLCYNINLEHRMNNVQKYIHADMSIHFKKNYKRDKGINQYIYNYKHNFYLRVFNFLLNFIKRTKNVINIVLCIFKLLILTKEILVYYILNLFIYYYIWLKCYFVLYNIIYEYIERERITC